MPAKVVLQPLAKATGPTIELQRVHQVRPVRGRDGCFATEVFKYRLVVTDDKGNTARFVIPFFFLPTLSATISISLAKATIASCDKLGAQLRTVDGVAGKALPSGANAQRVSAWSGILTVGTGIIIDALDGFFGCLGNFHSGRGRGAHYKYELRDHNNHIRLKTDPCAYFMECRRNRASIVWNNKEVQVDRRRVAQKRKETSPLQAPVSTYNCTSVRGAKKSKASRSAIANWPRSIEYLKQMGFTHVEFMPLAEHAFYPSWGYQVTGYFAPTSRYGTPEDLQYLVNELPGAGFGCDRGLGAHFPRDDWALARFDGTALEHAKTRKGAHQDWGTLIFNFGRNESQISSSRTLFWCERYHIDGLRVDAVASMLYLDYSRKHGRWIPNKCGGRENLEAIDFSPAVQSSRPHGISRRDDHRGRIHRLAAGDATTLRRRAGLFDEVEHGLDARHAGVFQRDPVHRKVSPARSHVRDALSVSRKFHPAALAR